MRGRSSWPSPWRSSSASPDQQALRHVGWVSITIASRCSPSPRLRRGRGALRRTGTGEREPAHGSPRLGRGRRRIAVHRGGRRRRVSLRQQEAPVTVQWTPRRVSQPGRPGSECATACVSCRRRSPIDAGYARSVAAGTRGLEVAVPRITLAKRQAGMRPSSSSAWSGSSRTPSSGVVDRAETAVHGSRFVGLPACSAPHRHKGHAASSGPAAADRAWRRARS
jgi:hypothetical protein